MRIFAQVVERQACTTAAVIGWTTGSVQLEASASADLTEAQVARHTWTCSSAPLRSGLADKVQCAVRGAGTTEEAPSTANATALAELDASRERHVASTCAWSLTAAASWLTSRWKWSSGSTGSGEKLRQDDRRGRGHASGVERTDPTRTRPSTTTTRSARRSTARSARRRACAELNAASRP